jgi:hypothetical protein
MTINNVRLFVPGSKPMLFMPKERISWETASTTKVIQSIEISPTSEIVFMLGGGDCVIYGGIPFIMELSGVNRATEPSANAEGKDTDALD